MLTLGIDDLRAPLALGLGLPGDCADHALIEIDVLDLDIGDFDAPAFGLAIEDLLDVAVELVAFGEHLVEIVLAQHRTQCCLRKLAGRLIEVRDLHDSALGIDDLIIDDGGHAYRDIIVRNDVLRRHVVDARSEIDLDHLLHERNEQNKPGTLYPGETAEREHYGPLVLAHDLHSREDDNDDDNDGGDEEHESAGHGSSSL